MMASAAMALMSDRNGHLTVNMTSRINSSIVDLHRNSVRLVYNRQSLIHLCTSRSLDTTTSDSVCSFGLLRQLRPVAYKVAEPPTRTSRPRRRQRRCDRKRNWGSWGGLLANLRSNSCRTLLPSILLAKVQFLENKSNYLKLDLTTKRVMRDCCTFILSETGLNSSVPDEAVSIEGLTLFRADRSNAITRKSRSNGVCIYISNSWYNNAEVVLSHCSPDIESFTVKCRPLYLHREFTTVTLTAVYMPPRANTVTALNTLHKSISDLQTTHPDDVFIVAGNFNQANMKIVWEIWT